MPKNFLDLEEAVREWAWRLYDNTATRKQRNLREKEQKKGQKYIGINIDWSDCMFKDTTHWSRIADDDGAKSVANGGKEVTVSQGDNAALRAAKPSQVQASDVSVLFQTKFKNNTSDPQEYTMRTEKTTRSACETTVENGYTKGFSMEVTLKSPCEVFEANAGYSREYSLSQSQGECFEEELTWGVESVIKVKANHMAEAELTVQERKQSGDFQVESKIQGMAYVNFTNIRDNNSFLKSIGGDIANIVEKKLTTERRKGEEMGFVTIQDDVVTILTRGSCKFRYGVRQEVVVNQTPLSQNHR